MVLSNQISAGEKKLAEGQQQYNEGQKMLQAGKARLAAGKQQLSRGKKRYQKVGKIPFSGLSKILPEGKIIFDAGDTQVIEGRKKIAEGERQIAAGQKKVRAGEARLKAGRLALARDKNELNQAKQVRDACGLGAIFLALLSILLGFFWRRSIIAVFKH
jgi:uncharacterized phage infection (PIP) family protein YhgE